jgi:hypothetical protein
MPPPPQISDPPPQNGVSSVILFRSHKRLAKPVNAVFVEEQREADTSVPYMV